MEELGSEDDLDGLDNGLAKPAGGNLSEKVKLGLANEKEKVESDRSVAVLEFDCKPDMEIEDAMNQSFCAELMETELMMRATLEAGRLESQADGMAESGAGADDVLKEGDE